MSFIKLLRLINQNTKFIFKWTPVMTIYVFHDGRYFVDDQCRIWTLCNADSKFWARYLKIYKSVVVVARAKDISSSELDDRFRLVSDSDKISIYALPYFVGPLGYIKNLF